MRAAVLVDQYWRYLTRLQLNMPKAQVLKTAIAVLLGFVIVGQLLSGTSEPQPQAKKISVVKPGQTSNENYATLPTENLENTRFSERCSKFFEALQGKESTETETQEFDTFTSMTRSFSLFPEWEEYLANKKKEAGEDYTSEKDKEWLKEYTKEAAADMARAARFQTFLSNARIYGTCYIETNIFEEVLGGTGGYNLLWSDEVDETLDETNLFHISNEFGLKYFSWMTQISPVFKKIGSSYVESSLPAIEPSYEPQTVGKASFMYNFRQSLNGRGIVIPVKDADDVEYVLKLAKVLRFIGCNLPIQIVHDGIIDEEVELKINAAFTGEILHTDFLTLETTEMLPVGFDVNFSPIENVWLVNLALSIEKKYSRKVYRDTSFKTLALLFSSFEDGLLIDPKVIPLRKVLSIMETSEFEMTGSYYFPDFQLAEDISKSELDFFNKLFPTEIDEYIFGIAEVNMQHLSQTRMFGEGKTHAINNNVVALNTKDHFLGLLLTLQLQFMLITYEHESLLKDLLWIGPLTAGASKLYIHDVPAAVVGEYTPEENRKIKTSVASEICSQHMGYLDSTNPSNATLMFFTGGALNCDGTELDMEKEKGMALFRSIGKEEKKIKEWSGTPTKFHGAIIPLKQEFVAKNNIDEVDTALQNYGYCGDNIWCAYDVLAAKNDPAYHGVNLEFDSATQTTLKLITEVWVKF